MGERRLPKKMLLLLRHAEKAATFENASFFFNDPTNDEVIKLRTKAFRENEILSCIRRVIEWGEEKT